MSDVHGFRAQVATVPSAHPASALTKVRSATAKPLGTGPVVDSTAVVLAAGGAAADPEAERVTGGGAEPARADELAVGAGDVGVTDRDEAVT
jgi:hypothetical protein